VKLIAGASTDGRGRFGLRFLRFPGVLGILLLPALVAPGCSRVPASGTPAARVPGSPPGWLEAPSPSPRPGSFDGTWLRIDKDRVGDSTTVRIEGGALQRLGKDAMDRRSQALRFERKGRRPFDLFLNDFRGPVAAYALSFDDLARGGSLRRYGLLGVLDGEGLLHLRILSIHRKDSKAAEERRTFDWVCRRLP